MKIGNYCQLKHQRCVYIEIVLILCQNYFFTTTICANQYIAINIAAAIKENINDPNEIIKLPIHIEVKITIVCTDRQFFIHDLVLLE